ncbi:Pro-kumamolisin [Diaporthe helianthi]|uniref:tripeptidyl-peptidase II n=1 Tax=Diaporthe helianthi TaxID=158607 RepID=A0A2P5HL56_DIAHE|nr:Pro-kumamolisin [Diaporthe helianthi]
MLYYKLMLASCAASAVAYALNGASHSLHERRSDIPDGWTRHEALDRRAVLPMRIGLKQRNLDMLPEWLSEVSHPKSERYGQHWSAKEVAEAFAPSDETVNSVRSWLISAGVAADRIRHSQSLAWLEFNASADEAERLLNTKYYIYEHQSGQEHVACTEYSIPSSLKEHIDMVYPTVHFDVKPRPQPRHDTAVKPDITRREKIPGLYKGLGAPGSGSLPKGGYRIGSHHKSTSDLSTCDEFITPDCLRALYRFPVNRNPAPGNSYGIVEYTPQAYVPSDLDLFFANFSPKAVGVRPILNSIDGGVVQQTEMGFEFNGESNLDLEYAMALVYPQMVTLYQVGDLVEGASLNNFLDAIDGSYCTYEGGDDPNQDATYPDEMPMGYQGPQNCGGFAATKVISTSSGDYGVAGNDGQCIDGPGINAKYNNGTSGRFNPGFPGTCPYVTAVGATQVKPNASIADDLATGVQPEEACETVIYSGGGFSNVFPLPDYQADAVHGWFADNPPPYGADRFNNSQQTRAFPDISANGAKYVVAVNGNFSLLYGTSASSPTLGSILTLINQERLKVGKSSIGFVNPVAYANPEIFNDITEGTNQGCGTKGFSSAPGWDPVTGLGTPNYPKMLKLWLSLD